MDCCTSCSATSMFRLRLNCSVMTEQPVGAGGGHLLQPGHLAELPLQRRGHRRRHHVRTGARIKRHHLNGRIVHFRQRRDRQLLVRHAPGQQNADHQQRRRHRPEDECPGRTHLDGFPAGFPRRLLRRLAASRYWPRLPGAPPLCCLPAACRRPVITTTSPATTPEVISVLSSSLVPILTWRTVTVESGFTRYT